MKQIITGRQFDKDFARMLRRGKDPAKIELTIDTLANGLPLLPRHRDHPLTGNYTGYRDCHIEPDWLLIYRTTEATLYLYRTGTHTDLFG